VLAPEEFLRYGLNSRENHLSGKPGAATYADSCRMVGNPITFCNRRLGLTLWDGPLPLLQAVDFVAVASEFWIWRAALSTRIYTEILWTGIRRGRSYASS
jgi:hypothetical protein